MSDFLHNLRTGNIKRFDRPRKNYDNPQYRQHSKDRKGNYHKKAHTGEQLQEIKKYMEGLAKTVEENFKVQARAAAALERIAAVLENSANIGPVADTAPESAPRQPLAASQPIPEANTGEQPTASDTKEDLLALIRSMRNSGATFEKIAGELEQRQVPTISGRGKWRGPAVSKLLKEHA